MRPRHYTAENREAAERTATAGKASMRPRHYTAENAHELALPVAQPSGFNEAAALHRGKLTMDSLTGVNDDTLQ